MLGQEKFEPALIVIVMYSFESVLVFSYDKDNICAKVCHHPVNVSYLYCIYNIKYYIYKYVFLFFTGQR